MTGIDADHRADARRRKHWIARTTAVVTLASMLHAQAAGWPPDVSVPWSMGGFSPPTCVIGYGEHILYVGPAFEPALRWQPGWVSMPGQRPYWRLCGAATPSGRFWMNGRLWAPRSRP